MHWRSPSLPMSPEPRASIKSGKSTVPNAGLTKARPQHENQGADFRRQLGGQALIRARDLRERRDGGASPGNPTHCPTCFSLLKGSFKAVIVPPTARIAPKPAAKAISTTLDDLTLVVTILAPCATSSAARNRTDPCQRI